MQGNMDKSILGTGGGGLVHTVFNEHGPEAARVLLGQIQSLSNVWILHISFTVGVGDTIADRDTLKTVRTHNICYLFC
jgi:DNA-directed RNA polymerase II subunit RPB1